MGKWKSELQEAAPGLAFVTGVTAVGVFLAWLFAPSWGRLVAGEAPWIVIPFCVLLAVASVFFAVLAWRTRNR